LGSERGQVRTKVVIAASISLLAVASCGILYFPAYDLGLPIGYYGKVNRVLARLAACPHLEVTFVAMHRDLTLEDFWITVRDASGAETQLEFVNANVRPVSDLAHELSRVGCK
jgi:hypothetical protein